jgi:hypothetical protein
MNCDDVMFRGVMLARENYRSSILQARGKAEERDTQKGGGQSLNNAQGCVGVRSVLLGVGHMPGSRSRVRVFGSIPM